MHLQGQNINRICQHKNVAYSCKVSTPDRKENRLHYIGLTEHTFKDRLYRYNNFFKYESKRNLAELSIFKSGKKKDKINVDLDWSILDKAKSYSLASKKWMLRLTGKYHIVLSTKNLLNKRNELVTKCRHENKFILQRPATIIACSKHFFPKRL